MISTLLLTDLLLQQNCYAVQKPVILKKIILSLSLNQIESNFNKYLNNFDLNGQIKSVLFFYLFSAVLPYINYKKNKKNKNYGFSFKILLSQKSLNFFLPLLLETNGSLLQPNIDVTNKGVFKYKHGSVALNFVLKGNLIFETEYLFEFIYADLRLTSFFFSASFIFTAPSRAVTCIFSNATLVLEES